MNDEPFYGPDQAAIHHEDFGRLAAYAAESLLAALRRSGLSDGTVLDLGSGSGILARAVSDAGYDVVGVDISPAMVELARANAPGARFEVGSLLDAAIPPGTVGVAAVGEALNYATDERVGLEEVERLARRVHDALEPGGVFLFDVSTPGREGEAGTRHQWHDRDEWTLFMRTREEGATLDRFITIFARNGDGTYRRTDEHHILRLYEPADVESILRAAGFEVEVRDDYEAEPELPPLAGWKVFVARA